MARTKDPAVRTLLIERAARMLRTREPVTLRSLVAGTGVSTMAVYTHFGGKQDLVRAMCVEGFDRLARRMRRVKATDDPVADLAELGRAYRRNALANPHLYAVMFGGRTVSEYTPTPADRSYGLPTLQHLVDTAARCVAAGRFRPAEPWPLALQLWAGAHGVVSLELDGFDAGTDAAEIFEAMMATLAIGFGDDPDRVAASLARGGSRPSRNGRRTHSGGNSKASAELLPPE
jgi:AcrR family transcriptional regulator